MTQTLGEALVVENAGGAGRTVGAARASRADADGYTLMINHVAQASSGSLYRKLAYDPDADFDSIGLITDVSMTIVARADLEPTDIASYIDYLKANGGSVLCGHASVGSASHLCGMLLMARREADGRTVQGNRAGNDRPARWRVRHHLRQTTNTIPQIGANTIKGYAVTKSERINVLPNLPTLQEAGLEGFEMTVWHGLFAPAGTPPEILEKLSGAPQTALQDPKVIERFAELGATPVPIEEATPAAMDAHLAAEITKWQPVIESAGEFAD